MSRKNHFNTPRTYRLTPLMAFQINKTARALSTSESNLVRTLIQEGIDKIQKGSFR